MQVCTTSRAKELPMPGPHYQNRILASLPREAIARLAPHLLPVALLQGQTLMPAGLKIHYAYFLEAGLASVVTTIEKQDVG
jgi:CRP-like cAMP-binding protein